MIVGSAKRESREKTVCLSCVKEGYHALDRGFLKGIGTGGHRGGERGGYGKEAGAVRRREKALKPGREELRVGAGKKREGSRGGGRARLRGKGRGGLLSRGLRRGCGSACKTKKQRAVLRRRPVGNKVLALFYFPT